LKFWFSADYYAMLKLIIKAAFKSRLKVFEMACLWKIAGLTRDRIL